MKNMVDALKKNVKGKVILPGDSNYDEARKIYNAMIDKYPAIILQCENEDDVIEGVKFGNANKMDVSIKSGGHNGAGLSLVDKGLVIDLSNMKKITIDPKKRTAVIQAGCKLNDVDKATHEHGLALPMGINSTTALQD